MLVIRLRRLGRKHDPHFRVVVAEHTAPVQGKFVAEIGHYHPKSKECVINASAFVDWLNKGAKPSNTVARLAQKNQLSHKHSVVKMLHKKPKSRPSETAAKPDRAVTSDAAPSEIAPIEANASDTTAGKTPTDEPKKTLEPIPATDDTVKPQKTDSRAPETENQVEDTPAVSV